MDNGWFDAVTRQAAASSRYDSLTAQDKKRHSKKKHGKKKQGEQCLVVDLCAPQVDACSTFVLTSCAGDSRCAEAASTCCQEFGACSFNGWVTCLLQRFS